MKNTDTPETDALEKTPLFADRPKDPICGEALLHARKLERQRDRYKAWAHKFRDLLAPPAWLDGVDNPNDTEKAIIQFDEENTKDVDASRPPKP